MRVLNREVMPLKTSSDVVMARQKVRLWAVDLKFSLVDQTKLVTAASELARNALDHGLFRLRFAFRARPDVRARLEPLGE